MYPLKCWFSNLSLESHLLWASLYHTIRHFNGLFYPILNLQVIREGPFAFFSSKFWLCSNFLLYLDFSIFLNSTKSFHSLSETSAKQSPCSRAFRAPAPGSFLLTWWLIFFQHICIAQWWDGVGLASNSKVHEDSLPTVSRRNSNSEGWDRCMLCK